MTTMQPRTRLFITLLVGFATVTFLVMASTASAQDTPAPDPAQPEPEQPAPTEAPPPEPAPEPTGGEEEADEADDEGLGVPAFAFFLVAAIALLLVFLAGRGSDRGTAVTVSQGPSSAPPPMAPPARDTTTLRRVYSGARVCLDRLDARAAGTPVDEAQLRRGIEGTLSEIYAAEASATGPEQMVLDETAQALNGLDRAVHGMGTGAVGSDPQAVAGARQRLVNALNTLAEHVRSGA